MSRVIHHISRFIFSNRGIRLLFLVGCSWCCRSYPRPISSSPWASSSRSEFCTRRGNRANCARQIVPRNHGDYCRTADVNSPPCKFYSVGWIILIVYGMQVSWTAVPRRRSWITTGVVLLLVLGCFRTVLRNNDWTSRETLIKYVIRDYFAEAATRGGTFFWSTERNYFIINY